jgi:predicted ATPase
MIQLILANNDIHDLLLIGAYRDNEVDETHPLMKVVSTIQMRSRFDDITLLPLEEEDIQDLLHDTFRCPHADNWNSLAKLIFQKTQVLIQNLVG